MSLMPAPNALQLLGEISKLLAELPPGALPAALDLVRLVSGSADPEREFRLHAMAAASKAATEEAIQRELEKKA